MLRLTEFTVSKFNSAGEQLALKDFIFAIVYAVTCTIHGLILQLPVPNFLPYFKLFIDSFTGKWVINVLPQILEGRAKTIVGQLGHIITSLKNVRIKIVHQRLCKKVRHKNCEYTTKSWHHDDILGCSYTTSNVLKEENNYCAVSCVFMILTRFLTEVTKPEIALRILHAMEQCGTCCCFPASPLVTRLTKLMQTSFREDKKCVLLVLEKTVYREIGAVSEFDGNEVLCSACQHSNDNSGKQWSWLEAFKHLLLSPDPDLTSVVASHLLSIAPHCSLTFQKKMLFTVFYPAFRIFKKKYECHRLEKDKNGTIACLSAFTHLLGKVRFAEEFVEQEGASENILELLKFPEFSTLSITVVQTAIIVKLWKLEKSNCPNVLDEGIKELQTLVNCVEDSIKCFLTTIKKLQGCFKEDSGNYPIVFRKEIEWDSYIGMLEELRLYWKSWMDLCLLSPQIRAYFTRHLSIKCYTLLVMFLQHIVRSISIEAEGVNDIQEKLSYSYRLHLTILEALIVLSVIAPYAGNPGGVFDLKSKLEKVVESKIGLRPICDVLLRSSGANPSQNIMFPTYPVPQVSVLIRSSHKYLFLVISKF
ncbi:hypothetical protein AAG570_006437 [Ranatra chinensis]|uniref:Uncharacterized protein n=1 Tax=Ranatra chinensis TaxID=642074 RepID=A0ABD0ZB22_9HEMI